MHHHLSSKSEVWQYPPNALW